MADLDVAIVVRLINRLGAPALAARRSIQAMTVGVRNLTESSGQSTKAAGIQAKAIDALSVVSKAGASAALGLGRGHDEATDSINRSGRAADSGARKFGLLERMQRRGSAATRMLGGDLDKLNSKIGKLALASIATNGMDRAGRGILNPLFGSVAKAADFQRGMTGIGIVGDLTDRQLGPVRSNIMASAQRLGIPLQSMQEDDMAVINEGVYRNARDLIAASKSAARLGLLSQVAGTPITGAQAGGLMGSYAHSMLAPAGMLDRMNATLFRATQLGGMRIGNVARFLPEIMGQMKSRAFANYQGFVDANAALQIVKRFTGDDEKAGIDTFDLLQNLNHMLTDRRFAKAGLNVEKIIADAHSQNVSALTASISAIISKIGANPDDPGLAGKLGKFFQNAQAGQAAAALITNQRDTAAGPGYDTFRGMIADPKNMIKYFAALKKASNDPYASIVKLQNAQEQIAIATGTILFPALNKVAGAAMRISDIITGLQAKGGFFAKAVVYAASAAGVLALSAGAVGNAIVGIVGPLWIARSLIGRVLPLATRAAVGGLAGLVGGLRSAAIATGIFSFSLRGLLAASGIGLLILAAGWIVQHWRGVATFFKGFGQGFVEAVRPVLPVLLPITQMFGQLAKSSHAIIGGKALEDWTKWGVGVGRAVGGVAARIISLLAWFGRLAGSIAAFSKGVFTDNVGERNAALGGVVASVSAIMLNMAGAGAASHQDALAAIQAGAHHGSAAPTDGKRQVQVGPIHQTFHVHGADPKAVLSEAQKSGSSGVRRALHDAADG